MRLKLKAVLTSINKSQIDLAGALGVSAAMVAQVLNHNIWPRTIAQDDLKERIRKYLARHGAAPVDIKSAFERCGQGAESSDTPLVELLAQKEITMLLRKQTLTPDTKNYWRLRRDPFTDELRTDEDVFLPEDFRAARVMLRQIATEGGMLALIAESGAGKSTLRHDLIEWIKCRGEPITVIEPYVLGMEDTNNKGRTLKAADITSAVIRAIAPGAALKLGHQARAEQMHKVLIESARIGRKHLLIIEEAHCLATPTLKHLKRFYEIQDGFEKLLSIVLVGQTELNWKLSEHNPEVREVVQRCEIVRLNALGPALEDYLRHKFRRVAADFDAIFEPCVVPAIDELLQTSLTRRTRGRSNVESVSLCYPLAVNNLVSATLNQAMRISAPKVTGELVKAAVRRQP